MKNLWFVVFIISGPVVFIISDNSQVGRFLRDIKKGKVIFDL